MVESERKNYRPFYTDRMDKPERVEVAQQFGGLDNKRFELSFNPEIRNRLKDLKQKY